VEERARECRSPLFRPTPSLDTTDINAMELWTRTLSACYKEIDFFCGIHQVSKYSSDCHGNVTWEKQLRFFSSETIHSNVVCACSTFLKAIPTDMNSLHIYTNIHTCSGVNLVWKLGSRGSWFKIWRVVSPEVKRTEVRRTLLRVSFREFLYLMYTNLSIYEKSPHWKVFNLIFLYIIGYNKISWRPPQPSIS